MSETALPPPRPFHKFLPSKLYADNLQLSLSSLLVYVFFWNFAREQQVSSVPAKYYYIPVALQHRRHLSQIIYVTE